MISFTPRPLYPCGKNPRCLLDRGLSGPQSRPGQLGEVKIRTTSLSQSLYQLRLSGSFTSCNINCTYSFICNKNSYITHQKPFTKLNRNFRNSVVWGMRPSAEQSYTLLLYLSHARNRGNVIVCATCILHGTDK
jgi:hypothetical protein